MDLAVLLYDDSIMYACPFLTPSQAPCCDCCWSQTAVLNKPLLWTTTAVLAVFCALHAHGEYRTKRLGLNLHKGKFRLVKKRSTSLPTKNASNSSDWLFRENAGSLLQENFVVVFYVLCVCGTMERNFCHDGHGSCMWRKEWTRPPSNLHSSYDMRI